ncbi:MAG: hypothetical protein PHH59_15880 [Methylovulum sp.]|uniref:hypothetical protein n=1 Tax=Methylovulum sp. TaxID=1916980 RepID=UPI0026150E8A|nr:hypothetical protein [Methylovulum sp.]MDD2725486.1 hypothetical protein [Methylovulum sp.]MDD5125138.1 hypothetical protein [Methylovulum sp.]
MDSDLGSISELQNSWSRALASATEPTSQELILALLGIHQVKSDWQALAPPQNSGIPPERFEEQLTLEIANFYARQARDSHHHIPCFFDLLLKRGEST